MQATLDIPASMSPVNEEDAHDAARDYVAAHIDPAFEAVSGTCLYSKARGRQVWQFVVRCTYGPLDVIEVDAQSGEVISPSDEKIRVIREKAAIYTARQQGVLPIDAQGYVVGEYARRQAESYLGDQLGMYFNGADPVFVLGEPPRWQVTIVFKRYHTGPFTLGVMDVDAQTGEPISLSKRQLHHIRERVHALVASQPQTAAA